MSRTGVGCRVLIDGKQLDDGCIIWANPPAVPLVGQGVAATDGLSVVWGRSTTVDQPRSSSCTFTVTDDPGGLTVLQTIALGQRVDVYADANLSGGSGSGNTFEDPGFETSIRSTIKANATVARQSGKVSVGSWAGMVTPTNASAAATVQFPPGVIQPTGTNPAAWAALRSTNPGETWTITIDLFVPSGMTVRVRPVLYSGPWATAAVVDSRSVLVTGAGTWTKPSVTFYPATGARWIGFQLETGGGGTWAQVNPATTWGDVGDLTWGDSGIIYVDQVSIAAPTSGTATTVQVFSGRITDLSGFYDDSWDQPSMDITASDFLADLGNRYIGSEPWAAETVSNRVVRILDLAKVSGEPAVTVDIAPTLGPIVVSWMDVDRQGAAGLLTDIAQSVDGVLWSATHPVIGPYIRLEDPAQRLPMYQLAYTGPYLIEILPIDFSTSQNPPPSLSSCDILRDPVTFLKSVADLATRVDVSWLSQVGTPTTGTEERSFRIINPSLEGQFGTRSVSVQTILTTDNDAERVADQIIARLGADWRVEGLEISDADVTVPDVNAARSILNLLNGVTRGGQALLLTDLADWSPVGTTAPIYLEGGTYTFQDGGWSLSLIVSRAAGVGQSATWDQIPNLSGWIWDAWEPSITWDDLRGVAGPDTVAQRPEIEGN